MRTRQLAVTGVLACAALGGALALTAWPDDQLAAAVAGARPAGVGAAPTASATGVPARPKQAESTPVTRAVRAAVTSTRRQQQITPPVKPSATPSPISSPPWPLPRARFASVTAGGGGQAGISPDGQALTVTFSSAEVTVSGTTSGTRYAKKTIPVVVTTAAGTKQGRVRVFVQGYALTEGATGSLTVSGAGRQVVRRIGDNADGDFLQAIDLTAPAGSTVRVSPVLDLQGRGGAGQPADG